MGRKQEDRQEKHMKIKELAYSMEVPSEKEEELKKEIILWT